MKAQTMIKHAQNQGITLSKIGDPAPLAVQLMLATGDNVSVPITPSPCKGNVCDWCDAPATHRAESAFWTDLMCARHALRYGRFERA